MLIDPLDIGTKDRRAWSYLPGQRRVKVAPDLSHDTPNPGTAGATTFDDTFIFNGSMDRFDFKLVGKKEMLVPYNAYAAVYQAKQDDLLKPNHLNPDLVRWELHRVWVVEATLKEGKRHVYSKRTFYLDEDSWAALASDEYDARGQLYRTGFAYMAPSYDLPAPYTDMFGHYDLVVARLLADRLHRRDRRPAPHQAAVRPRVDGRLAGRRRRPLKSRAARRTIMQRRTPAAGRWPPARRCCRSAAPAPPRRRRPAAPWRDVLDTPAQKSPLAPRGLLNGLARAGKRVVAVGQRGHVLLSDDAGKSWQQADVPVSADLVAVHFPDAEAGWAVGHDGVVLHSTDGGRTWVRQLDGRSLGDVLVAYYERSGDEKWLGEAKRFAAQGAENPFLDVWFHDARNGYVVGAFGLVLRTADGGETLGAAAARHRQPEEPAPVRGAPRRRAICSSPASRACC